MTTVATIRPSLDLASIFPEIQQISDPDLRRKVDQLWQRLWQESKWQRLEDVPVSSKIKRSHLPHAQAVVRLAVAAAEVAEQIHGQPVNRDILLAAAIVQDAGKLVEYEPAEGGHGFQRAQLGLQLQHSMYAAHVAMQLELPLEVVHIMLAHSPSTTLAPRSRECALLFWIDQLDLANMGEEAWGRSLMHQHH
jgi:hypothetical protein